MKRLILLGLAVHCCCAATAVAGDFLLRLDTVGFDDQAKSVQVRDETVLFRLETIARPGMNFYSRVVIGAHTHLLRGKLHATDGGFSTLVTATPGTPVTLAGLQTEETTTTLAGEKTSVSLRRHVLILTEYEQPRTDAK